MTSYQTVYDAFLSKVTADDWANEFEGAGEDLLPTAEALEDLMNTKNYTITQLVQYVLQELLREE